MVITGWMLWLGPRRIKARKNALTGKAGKSKSNE
jgi:hypothetical protein